MFNLLYSQLDITSILAFIIAYISAILIAMTFHEFAHAKVALKQGDKTAQALGRCSLKPFSHVDGIGFACLLIFGFGWAKPVPVDSRNFKHGKKSEFLVSIAGVLTNLILAIIFAFIFALLSCVWPEIFTSTGIYGTTLLNFLYYSVIINFSLFFFNLLPIYPLDGFRIIESFTGRNTAFSNFIRNYSNFLILIIFISGLAGLYISYTAVNAASYLMYLFNLLFGAIF